MFHVEQLNYNRQPPLSFCSTWNMDIENPLDNNRECSTWNTPCFLVPQNGI